MTPAVLSISRENQLYLICLTVAQCHLHNVKFRSSIVTCFNSFTILMSIWSTWWKRWQIPSPLFHTRLGLNQVLNFLPVPIALQEFPAFVLPTCLSECWIGFAAFCNGSFQIKCLHSIKEITSTFKPHSSFFSPINCKNLHIWLMQLHPDLQPHFFSHYSL